MAKRTYTTWEEDFSSDRCELHGYEDELVAVIEPLGGSWTVKDRNGAIIALRPDKKTAQECAQSLLWTEPTVCAIILTRDRPEMAARAVRSFRAQTYAAKWLTVYNTGDSDEIECGCNADCYHIKADARGDSIGKLRNRANAFINEYRPQSDIIIHFDDDDVSHPNRIAEQVALLQSSGAECVGYRECLFWRTVSCIRHHKESCQDCTDAGLDGEAWLYSVPNPTWVMGASLCYWRKTWGAHPFPDLPKRDVVGGSSEDVVWRREVKCLGGRALAGAQMINPLGLSFSGLGVDPQHEAPRLVCGIHGGNTMAYDLEKYPDTWRRVPAWDDVCRGMMEL